MLLIAPIVLIGAGIVGYWLAGHQPAAGAGHHGRAGSDQRRAEPPPPARGAAVRRRDRPPRPRREPHAGPVGGELRQLTGSPPTRATSSRPRSWCSGPGWSALVHPATPNEVLQSLDETLAQINQMSEMVENLLTLARADEGRRCSSRSPTSATSRRGGDRRDARKETSGITVRSEMPAAPVRLAVDRHWIREMLLNLVTNAIKYTGKGGTVGLRLDDRRHLRRVGHGHRHRRRRSAAHRAVLRPTRHARAPATGPAPGWAGHHQRIAEAHGGSITVQSRPGRGTVFTVRCQNRGLCWLGGMVIRRPVLLTGSRVSADLALGGLACG